MTFLLSLLQTLALAVLTAPVLVPSTAPSTARDLQPAETSADESGFETAVLEWKQALKDHKAALKKARKSGNSAEVKARHPAKTFYGRFEKMVAGGEGRALLWMAENAHEAFDGKQVIAGHKRDLWRRLVSEHSSDDWASSIPYPLARQRRYLGNEELRALLLSLGENSSDPEVSAESFSRLAGLLDKRKTTPEEKARAVKLRKRILQDYPTSFAAIDLDPEKYKQNYLAVGKLAPDFTCEDVDGTEFKLSDYRGKVVMLDFWGFW